MTGHKSVFAPGTVLMEVEWVLRGVYGLPPERIIPALRAAAECQGFLTFDKRLTSSGIGLTDIAITTP